MPLFLIAFSSFMAVPRDSQDLDGGGRPDKFPGPFKSFRGSGQLILRVVVLTQPAFRVAAVPAIIPSRGFALDDVNEKGHTKKAGE